MQRPFKVSDALRLINDNSSFCPKIAAKWKEETERIKRENPEWVKQFEALQQRRGK